MKGTLMTGAALFIAIWGFGIRQWLPGRSHAMQAVFTWMMVSSFYAFQFFLRSSPNAISHAMILDFDITLTDISYLSAAYYIPYVILQIPLGIMLDRWGPKHVLRWGTAVCVIGTFVFAKSSSFSWAFVGRFLIGAGGAASLIGSIRMNSLWLSSGRLAFATGVLSGLGKMGGSAANGLLPLWLVQSSWQSGMQNVAWIGAFLCATIWLGARNGPNNQWVHHSQTKIGHTVKTILRTPHTWILGLYGCALYATLTVFSDTYSIPFLRQKMGLSLADAGQSAALVGLGSALGSALVTGWSDWLKKRLLFVRGCAFGTLTLAAIVIWAPISSLMWMNIALLGLGICSGGQILALTLVCDTTEQRKLGVTTGIINAFLMSGGMLFNPLVGKFLHYQWKGQWRNGAPWYDLISYQQSLSLLLVLFALALLVSWKIKETHPKNSKSCPAV